MDLRKFALRIELPCGIPDSEVCLRRDHVRPEEVPRDTAPPVHLPFSSIHHLPQLQSHLPRPIPSRI